MPGRHQSREGRRGICPVETNRARGGKEYTRWKLIARGEARNMPGRNQSREGRQGQEADPSVVSGGGVMIMSHLRGP
eukprot:56993-Prorocentrum_minimum.AAC.1